MGRKPLTPAQRERRRASQKRWENTGRSVAPGGKVTASNASIMPSAGAQKIRTPSSGDCGSAPGRNRSRRVRHGVRFDVPFVGGRSGPAAVDPGSLHLVSHEPGGCRGGPNVGTGTWSGHWAALMNRPVVALPTRHVERAHAVGARVAERHRLDQIIGAAGCHPAIVGLAAVVGEGCDGSKGAQLK
jgi:hypothetical protein